MAMTMNTNIQIKDLLIVLSSALILFAAPAYSTVLSAGEDHTCMLKSNGAAYCWGDNSVGQLGNGTTEASMTPVKVSGGYQFDSISAGWDHTCGVTDDNQVYCWGRGRYGRLGNGATNNSLVPVQVSGGLSFAAVNAGLAHTCGITLDGGGFCWGFNEDGILGNNSVKSSAIPVAVVGGISFGSLNAGSATTCGIADSGDAYCWGAGDFGRLLGQGPLDRGIKHTPGLVAGNFKFKSNSVSVGLDHTCAINEEDEAICWGRGRYGKLGIGSGNGLGVIENLMTPREVNGNISFAMVTTGIFQTCGISTAGKPYCWGRNKSGQLGDGTTTMRVEPVAVSTDLSFSTISIGKNHACGLASSDAVYCWGNGDAGKLGTGSSDNVLLPAKVASR